MRTAFYPGSFDPVTNGHLDVLFKAFRVADRVVVGIGVHPGKAPLFSFAEREEMLRQAIGAADARQAAALEIVAFEGLVTVAAASHGASLLIRGLRDGTDLDYEMQMAGMNGELAPDLLTVFLPAAPATRHITATLVRQIGMLGGAVEAFVPAQVAARLRAKAAAAG